MNVVRLAMLGCGTVAELYGPVFRYVEGCLPIAAADINRASAERFAARYGMRAAYQDVADIARDSEVDAVIVGTPPNLHAEHVETLAAAGKHVLCEKPIAATVHDCRRIIDACRASGVKLQMGHMKRFMRGNQKVKAIVDGGALGKVFMAECHWDCAVPGLIGSYREREETGGGSLQDHGPHCFDLVRWWTGADIRAVSASMRVVPPGRHHEDAVAAVLDHDRGIMSYHHLTRISYGREHAQDLYRLYGTEGTLVVRNDHHFPTTSIESPEITLYRSDGTIARCDTFHGWNHDDTVRQNNPFYNSVRAFCESIIEDAEPRVTGEDGMRAMEAVIAAYVSAWRGGRVALPLEDDVDLRQLFRQVRARDRRDLGSDYTVASGSAGPVPADPVFGFRPPRTGERWSARENGMCGSATYAELGASLNPAPAER